MNKFPDPDIAREQLIEIINTYFESDKVVSEMIELANRPMPPVKHILTELNILTPKISKLHKDNIKDIFFCWG